MNQANRAIETTRGPFYRKPSRAPLDFWEHTRRGDGWPETAYFELHGRRDEARTDPVGDWVLGAGVAWPRTDAPLEDAYPEWFARRWEEGFEIGSSSRNVIYLFRYLTLDELATLPTLTQQAQHLAAWALGTWSLLDQDPLARVDN